VVVQVLLKTIDLGVPSLVTVTTDGETLLAVRKHINLLVDGGEDMLRGHRRCSIEVILGDVLLQTGKDHRDSIIDAANTDDIPEQLVGGRELAEKD
jgi:hypothetical protein